MKRYCLALDLIDDEGLISDYEKYHKEVWPEIKKSILDSGIVEMEIYRIENRLFMIIETIDEFDFAKKMADDAANPDVREWEQVMWRYQQPLPRSKPGEKWRLMDKIFSLTE
jgi:L-rhamnose mutarotase